MTGLGLGLGLRGPDLGLGFDNFQFNFAKSTESLAINQILYNFFSPRKRLKLFHYLKIYLNGAIQKFGKVSFHEKDDII